MRDASEMPRVEPEAVGESRSEYEQPERVPRGFMSFVGTASWVFALAVVLAVIMVIAIIVLATR
jgi:hypothetical protein